MKRDYMCDLEKCIHFPDVKGGLKFDGVNQVVYDAENRVCAVYNSTMGGQVSQYIYDAEGRRVAKGHPADNVLACPTASNFVVDARYILGPSGEQITELDSSNQWKHTNVYAGGQLLATYDQEGSQQLLHFNISDPLATKRVQASASGTVEQTCTSLPFGDGPQCIGATEHFFTGKERDAESGLDYFGARHYSSTMGRFMSPDPSGLYYADQTNPQSLNLYSYVLNNPLKFTDPTGLYCYYDPDDGQDPDDTKLFDMHSSTDECRDTKGHWIDDPSTTVNVSANGDGSIDSYSSSFDGTVVTPYLQHSQWQGDPDDKRIQALSSNINTKIGPLLNIGNCGVQALATGVGSFFGYDPAPGSSDVVKTIRQGVESALVAKGGGAGSQGAAAIALEIAQAAKGVSKPFAAAVGRAAGSAVEKAVPALLLIQGGLAFKDAQEAFTSC